MSMFALGLFSSFVVTLSIATSTIIAFRYGYKAGLSVKKVTTKEEIDEDEKRKIKKRQEGLKNIMDYDYSKAIERAVK